MPVRGEIKKGVYFDSVTLMRVAKTLSDQIGVIDSALVMATEENKRLLKASALEFMGLNEATEMDLVISVKAETLPQAEALLQFGIDQLKSKKTGSSDFSRAKTIDSALEQLPGANCALISVAGRYAAGQAKKALESGLHVMLFSDNVSLEEEIELKDLALSKGLLVMGPDCGTAIIQGVPLGFANQVKQGPVGIVAASGTGLQEVSTLLSMHEVGVSQAIGTGGRDIKKEVGGRMFLQGLRELSQNPQTQVLLLVSKPPHETVLKKILDELVNIQQPVVLTFLGAAFKQTYPHHCYVASNLEEGALLASALAKHQTVDQMHAEISVQKKRETQVALQESKLLKPSQKYIRGLYTGGTFVSEAQVIAQELGLSSVYSNAPWGLSQMLNNALVSQAHTFIDFGEDEFTVGRPHPMIDFSLRKKRILEEAKNSETAVILLDLVLGWGAHRNPVSELVPVLKEVKDIACLEKRHLPIVMSVTGTDEDPQNRQRVLQALQEAGVLVFSSNASAVRVAVQMVRS